MITFSKLGKYGRFGNQMFQIAATISHAIKNNDIYCLPNWSYSHAFVGPFNECSDFSWVTNIYTEPNFIYSDISYTKNTDLFGYFQSEKYFTEDIKNIFRPNDIVLAKYNDYTDSCAIHVRRTDYLKYPDSHPFPGIKYYHDAMDMLSDQVDRFIIFSDDPQWCVENIKNKRSENILVINGTEDWEDMIAISACKHSIIANSTFSWWGSWIGDNENRIIIAPAIWFGQAYGNQMADDLRRKKWKLI